jgi:hypothetical protein
MDNSLDYVIIFFIALFWWELALCFTILFAGVYIADAINLQTKLKELKEGVEK